MEKTVVGIFENDNRAERAVERLAEYGFSRDRIDVSENYGSNYASSGSTSNRRDNDDNEGFGDKISNFFRNLFDTDDDVRTYSTAAKGGCVVSVFTDSSDEAERARDILDECGAVDVDDHARRYSFDNNDLRTANNPTAGDQDFSATGSEMRNDVNDMRSDLREGVDDLGRNTREGINEVREEFSDVRNDLRDRDIDRDNDSRSLPIIEENLHVGKREVEQGGVRIRSRIVEKPVEETVRLRRERVNVERHPVDRVASSDDLDTFKEGEIEMTERSEVPVVDKEARVVEEVNLSKEVDETEETINETLRKTEVDVDKIGRKDRDPERGDREIRREERKRTDFDL
jgi:uncharacterized protein (TIGR02271 family)